MSGLMNMVSRFARGRAAGRTAPSRRGMAGTGGVGGPGGVGGTAPAGRRGGQAAMAEGAVRKFLRRAR